MAAHKEGPLEVAMTHVQTHDEGRSFCARPLEVRRMAMRIDAWRSDRETCKSCQSNPAVRIVSGEALCTRCREQRTLRFDGGELLNRRVSTVRRGPVTGDGLVGYSIVFDQRSLDLGGFVEVIKPEAVNRTLSEGIDLRALWNHDSGTPLARMSAGTLRVRKDATGLLSEFVPPSTAAGYVETVGRGDVSQQSFGFRTIEDEWFMEGNSVLREVLDMRVSEISAVAFPAYPQTTLAIGTKMMLRDGQSVALLQRWLRNRA